MDLGNVKYVVVGAGFFGSSIAERIANDLNEHVVIIEVRNHIGGNSYSEFHQATGIEVHKYGSHIFHCSDKKVWDYINQFTSFNNYRHRVLTTCRGRVYSMPINLATINSFYNVHMRPYQAKAFLMSEAEKQHIQSPGNLEDKAISLMGRPLYDAFIRGYTVKQWQRDPRELPAEVVTRLPIRFSYNDAYFDDPWQGIPVDGYAAVFERMLKSPRIHIYLNVDFFSVREQIPKSCTIVYTGPIDRYFNYRYGDLGWRTLDYEAEIHDVGDYQGTSVMNYADEDIPYTRIHEFKHFHAERNYSDKKTIIFKEFSRTAQKIDIPYYPIRTSRDLEKLDLYNREADQEVNVIFGGRLGSYKYFDMHHSIEAALEVYEKQIRKN